MTPRQRAKIRAATRRRDADPSEAESELNIVPFLDIVINLMLFLLATSAATMVLAETNAELPSACVGCRGEATLSLSVTLTESSAVLSSRTGRLAEVPRTAEGYDFEALEARLAEVHEAHPDERSVVLSADEMVPYEHLIGAMDAIHGSFPDVRLSAGVR